MAREPRSLKPYVYQEFPRLFWNPDTGESKEFKAKHEVPEGWLNYHPADKDRAKPPAPPAPPPPAPDEDRTDVIARLRQNGFAFNPRASTKALRELLGE